MDSKRFRSRALHEGERYGEDPYVFLRELAQNSRDAGATRIAVTARIEQGSCIVEFDDDGVGMSFDEARTFLFRLYASSKERTASSAGRFGVGFWSVLRFGPESLEIESRRGGQGWAVTCTGDLERIEETAASRSNRGTKVTLRRPATEGDAHFIELLGARLTHYCKYLRRATRRRQPLPVTFNGRSVQEPMVLDSPVTLTFSSREAEGVVGLGPEPRVELYARGLWVTTVSVLEELDPDATARRPVSPGEGLAPVVILNSDALDVVLSRDKPIDGRALRRLLRLARARVDRLVEHAIDGVAPRSLHARTADSLRGMVRAVGGPAMAAVLAMWAFVLFGGAAALVYLHRADRPVSVESGVRVAGVSSPRLGQPYSEITGYRGATIDVPRSTGSDLSLTVDTDDTLYFRALSLEQYDPLMGWQERPNQSTRPHPSFRCEVGCVNVRMAVNPSPRPITIPVPTGYQLDPDSVRWSGEKVAAVLIDDSGAAMLTLNGQMMGLLSYQVGPAKMPFHGSVDVPSGAPLTREWRSIVHEHRGAQPRSSRRRARTTIQVAESVTDTVRSKLRYDVSAATARRFEAHRGLWTERVIATGAGDCDVKNGINVLLFRQLNIPARLAVGIVAVKGRARGGLHAWTEYHAKGRWWVADATGRPTPEPAAPMVPSVGSPALAAAPVPAREPTDVEVLTIEQAGDVASPPQRRARVERVPLPVPSPPPDVSPPALGPGDTTPTPVRVPPAAVSVPTPGRTPIPPWLPAAALGVAASLLIIWIQRRRQVDETLERRGEGPEQRAAVAGMVRELLRGSSGWRGVSALGHRRVLPTLKGPPLSLAEAMERSRRGRLWGGGRRSLLARSAAARGAPVVDIEDRYFGPLVMQTFDVVDLSMIEGLAVTQLPAALAKTLNPILEKHGHTTCVWSRHLGERALVEYDISDLKIRDAHGLPLRAIVINPDHPDVRARIELFERDPSRAAYGWIDWIVSRSMSCEPYASELRRSAASRVFAEDSA